MTELRDARGRLLRDLRVSVTDRCNMRCSYCMPRAHFPAGFKFLPRGEILRHEEVARVAGLLVGLGVKKIRLTGGEPLLRADLHKLIEALAPLPGVDLALTTNGVLLPKHAATLRAAGLARVTVSLDSLDADVFRAMTDSSFTPADVLAGVDAALAAGLGPIKINCVVRRGHNDGSVVALARRFHGTGCVVRFIEYMDVGDTNEWRRDDVVTGREIVEAISRELPLLPVASAYDGEVAKRWRYADGGGEIGVITSVTQPFCGACSRARLSARGILYTCLFASDGVDLRAPLRDGATDDELTALVRETWRARDDRYSELRALGLSRGKRIEMSYIGG
ncbi:MAG: GTP 3',8-cyclase MoaA [Polyangiaceae bacterium]|nr:GTP 3',8-cyclase MoaA [Polyangiaceae bacterium]